MKGQRDGRRESRGAPVPPVRDQNKAEEEEEQRKFRAATFYLEIPAEAKIGNASLFERSDAPRQRRRRLFLAWTTEQRNSGGGASVLQPSFPP